MKIRAKKSLGQNFLIDKNIIKSIVSIGDIKKNNVILEVGPGTGNLTEYILKKNPKKIFVIEKDSNLVNLLNGKFSDKINILNKDILKFDLNNISKEKIIIFGNLPYNISTKILTQWITAPEKFKCYKKLILMFQKEVADRIVADVNSNKYGRLSILTNWKMKVNKVMDIEPENFFPKPKVKSSIVYFEPKNSFFNFDNPNNLEKVTNIFFQNKRKMIKKPLNILFQNSSKVINKLELDEKSRPQNLNPQTFFKISKEFENELTSD